MAEIPDGADERTKQAQLWEKSVVQAFRDLQWLLVANRSEMPDINVPFAGKIEAAFGDGIVSADEKLFLLEFKANSAGKSAEWRDKKLSYQSLEAALKSVGSEQERQAMDGWFELSMRGHLFLYWSAEGRGKDSRVIPGDLAISSYLLDVARKSPICGFEPCIDLSTFNSIAVPRGELADVYEPKVQVCASRLFDRTASLVRQLPAKDPVALTLGLTPHQMQGYVAWLLERQILRDLPINALLASRNGAICQHISHVDDLADLLIELMNHPKPQRLSLSSDVELPLEGRQPIVVPSPEGDFPTSRP